MVDGKSGGTTRHNYRHENGSKNIDSVTRNSYNLVVWASPESSP